MAGHIAIRFQDLPKALQKREKAVRAAIQRGAEKGARAGMSLLIRKTPVDQGELKASWKVTTGGGRLATLTNTAPHVGIVELGARPHPVNREGWDAIYEWARRHFTVSPTGQRRRVAKATGADPELSRITWGIVKKIEKYGQAPTYFVRNAMPEVQRLAVAAIVREIEKVAGEKEPS
jgi:hypothetical protein